MSENVKHADVIDRLGLKTIINARGPVTFAGGAPMRSEAVAAMVATQGAGILLDELHQIAGQHIAKMLNVEAAYVSCGAAGGMLLASAAVLTGTDQDKIWTLPETDGWRNQIIVQRSKLPNFVYQAMRVSGARLVQVGTTSSMTLENISDAIGETTCAVQLYVGKPGQPPIDDVAKLLRPRGIPLIVDAAGELPPRSNFTQPLLSGADLIVFSGGKGIRGPQNTGLILGSRALIDACRLNGAPHKGIGRSMKVSKESICALVVALEHFLSEDESFQLSEYALQARQVADALRDIPGISTEVLIDDHRTRPDIPRVFVEFSNDFRCRPAEVVGRLLGGEPRILVGETPSGIYVDVMLLDISVIELVANKLCEVLRACGCNGALDETS